MKKKGLIFIIAVSAVILVMILLALNPRLAGRYYSRDNALINYIEFGKNRMVKFRILGMETSSIRYRLKGDTITVNVPTRGETLFKIVDSTTIKGVSSGFEGIYVRSTPGRLDE